MAWNNLTIRIGSLGLACALVLVSSCRTAKQEDRADTASVVPTPPEAKRYTGCRKVIWFVTGVMGSELYAPEDDQLRLFFGGPKIIGENLFGDSKALEKEESAGKGTLLDQLIAALKYRSREQVQRKSLLFSGSKPFSRTDLWRYVFGSLPKTTFWGIPFRIGQTSALDIYASSESTVQAYASQRRHCSKTFSFDWTMNTEANGRALRKAINDFQSSLDLKDPLNDGPQHVLVAHSMGGLVSLEAAQAPGPKLGEIAGIVAMKSPLRGSLKVIEGMFSGDSPLPLFTNRGKSRVRRVVYFSPGFWSLMPRYRFYFDNEKDFQKIQAKGKSILEDSNLDFWVDFLHENTREISANFTLPGLNAEQSGKAWIRMQLESLIEMEDRLFARPKHPYPPVLQLISRYYEGGESLQYFIGHAVGKGKISRKGERYSRVKVGGSTGQMVASNDGDQSVAFRSALSNMQIEALERLKGRDDFIYYSPSRKLYRERTRLVSGKTLAEEWKRNPKSGAEHIEGVFRFLRMPILRPGKDEPIRVAPLPSALAYGLNRGLALPLASTPNGPHFANVRYINATHVQKNMTVRTAEQLALMADSIADRRLGQTRIAVKSRQDEYTMTLNFRMRVRGSEIGSNNFGGVPLQEWQRVHGDRSPSEWFEEKMADALDSAAIRKKLFSFMVLIDRIKLVSLSVPAEHVSPTGDITPGSGKVFILRMEYWGLDGLVRDAFATLRLRKAFDFDELFAKVRSRFEVVADLLQVSGLDPLATGTYLDRAEINEARYTAKPDPDFAVKVEALIRKYQDPASPDFDPLFYASFFVGNGFIMRNTFGDNYRTKMLEARLKFESPAFTKSARHWYEYGPILSAMFVLPDWNTMDSEDDQSEVWEPFYRSARRLAPSHALEAMRTFRYRKLVDICGDNKLSMKCTRDKDKVHSWISCLAPSRGCAGDKSLGKKRRAISEYFSKPTPIDGNELFYLDPSLLTEDESSPNYRKMMMWRRAQGLGWMIDWHDSR